MFGNNAARLVRRQDTASADFDCAAVIADQENIDVMIQVMSSLRLYLLATEGYKITGTTNKFDGTEDWNIGRDAGLFLE